MRVAVIMTCFNRLNTTIRCLDHLAAHARLDYLQFDVWLNDDGCTDGTGKAVQEWFDSISQHTSLFTLHLIMGSGHDYWCGGMRRAWQAAIDGGIDYDGYLWLNDDTFLYKDFPESMQIGNAAYEESIIAGAVKDLESDRMTYGGFDEEGNLVPVNGRMRKVKVINGNCVYIPRKVFLKLGNFPSYLTHTLGDTDYSIRAAEAGINVYQSAKYVGECDDRRRIGAWKDSGKPFLKRMKALYSPLLGPEPNVLFIYNHRHYGLAQAIKVWIHQHIHAAMPALWDRMKSRK